MKVIEVPPRAAHGAQDGIMDVSDGARARANTMAGMLQDDIVSMDNACRHCRAGQPAQSSLSSRRCVSMAALPKTQSKAVSRTAWERPWWPPSLQYIARVRAALPETLKREESAHHESSTHQGSRTADRAAGTCQPRHEQVCTEQSGHAGSLPLP